MGATKRVLLVDDDDDILSQLELVIGREYQVATALSGSECLAAVTAQKPDLIVLDVIMDNLGDGLETAKKLKESRETAAIPIIMLTSVNESYDFRTQVDAGYYPNDRWLDKPVKPDAVLREIKALIG
jgi:two-component system alkaline phosphatase synthesis response regulator PhoP